MYTVLKQLMKDKMYRGLDTQNKNVTVFVQQRSSNQVIAFTL